MQQNWVERYMNVEGGGILLGKVAHLLTKATAEPARVLHTQHPAMQRF